MSHLSALEAVIPSSKRLRFPCGSHARSPLTPLVDSLNPQAHQLVDGQVLYAM